MVTEVVPAGTVIMTNPVVRGKFEDVSDCNVVVCEIVVFCEFREVVGGMSVADKVVKLKNSQAFRVRKMSNKPNSQNIFLFIFFILHNKLHKLMIYYNSIIFLIQDD